MIRTQAAVGGVAVADDAVLALGAAGYSGSESIAIDPWVVKKRRVPSLPLVAEESLEGPNRMWQTRQTTDQAADGASLRTCALHRTF